MQQLAVEGMSKAMVTNVLKLDYFHPIPLNAGFNFCSDAKFKILYETYINQYPIFYYFCQLK